MTITYSTSTVHPRDRVAYWREVATRAFVRHEFSSSCGPTFIGSIRSGSLAGLGVTAYECDPCEVGRTALDIARDDSDHCFLCLQLDGRGVFTQEGRQAVVERGCFVLVDSRRSYTTGYQTQTRAITLTIPRHALEARLGSVAGLTARKLDARGPVAGLASAFLAMLPARIDAIDGPAASKIAEQTLDLVALAFSAETEKGAVALSSARAVALLRLKSAIEASLGNPLLKPAAAAAAAGISVRYANALLAQEGSSVERYLLDRRLERCRRALEDPAQAHRTIGDIAFSWGFSDLSHFGRRFRATFGFTPSDYRRRGSSLRPR
ncbi:MAG TPA: helix-turn-helix domain-containing protein [Hyphomicrobiaceae bacterium]|nr:helix-turn-helix domain-containing protein [Hyphomicrobiaceae bacterium]